MYPNFFILTLSILLAYLSVLDWCYLSISYVDLGIVVLFTLLFSVSFYFHQYPFFTEMFPFKLGILMLVLVGYMFLIYFKKMGTGDFWIFILISFLLHPTDILRSLYISILIGGCYSLLLVIIDKKNLKKQIPFIPFISLGFLLTILMKR